jgi:DhnA family fructose-bisphosphate aldolase class Ia
MSKKAKLEKDYEDTKLIIERMAEEEIKRIQAKVNVIKKEAAKVGEDVELTIKKNETKALKKKLNT